MSAGHDSTSDAPLMATVSGCRGVVGASMTPATVCRYVGAFCAWLRDGGRSADEPIVVGRDGRLGGDALHDAAVAQVRASGFCAVDLGVAATPTVGVAALEHAAAGGLVITASHNPASWNGLKPVTSLGRAPSPDEARGLLEFFTQGRTIHAPAEGVGGRASDGAANHAHVARVLEALETVGGVEPIRRRRFRIAVDSVNAAGAAGARLLADALGCELTHLGAEETGVFPHPPEPTREHLAGAGGLCDAVRREGLDAGFAQDPDADRLAIIDERGVYIGEEQTLVIAVETLLGAGAGGGAVAANLSTSRMIDDAAARHGARVVRSPVGEAHVVAAMDERRCAIGGEGNGGVIWPAVVPIRDSLGAMALTLALMARRAASISEIVSSWPAYEIVKAKAPAPRDGPDAALDAVRREWADADLDTRDGVRVDLPAQRAWVHVRASNTEPILRLIAEAPNRAAAEALIDTARRAVLGER